MTKLPIGLQLYSIREDMEKDFFGTLEKVKEMGYDAIEFAGVFDKDPKEIKAKCDELGLNPISAHVGIPVLLPDIEGVVKMYSEIGCKFIAIPWASAETDLPGGTAYDEFLKNVKAVSTVAKKYGITLCYHNHDFEFEKINGENKLDIKKTSAQIKEICDKYGFEISPNQKVYDMTVSQKQTLEIITVLCRGANILILDEPTAVLTPQETEKLFKIIRNTREDGKSVIIITHKLHEVLSVKGELHCGSYMLHFCLLRKH